MHRHQDVYLLLSRGGRVPPGVRAGPDELALLIREARTARRSARRDRLRASLRFVFGRLPTRRQAPVLKPPVQVIDADGFDQELSVIDRRHSGVERHREQ